MTKETAARISNEGRTKLGRKVMARKAVVTRRGHLGKANRAARGN